MHFSDIHIHLWAIASESFVLKPPEKRKVGCKISLNELTDNTFIDFILRRSKLCLVISSQSGLDHTQARELLRPQLS